MNNPTICQAIDGMFLLQITYDNKIRLVEPHAYGVDKAGDELLRAWQQTPSPDDWRTFRVDRMTAVAITKIRFSGPHKDYARNDKAMTKIYCQL